MLTCRFKEPTNVGRIALERLVGAQVYNSLLQSWGDKITKGHCDVIHKYDAQMTLLFTTKTTNKI